MSKLKIFTDGGSRGNPGSAACAFVIQDENGNILHQDSIYLGVTTNNIAEYQGLKSALTHLLDNSLSYIAYDFYIFHLDSELVVRQINGIYKVKDAKIQELYTQIKSLIAKIELPCEFVHVPRASNQIADKLLNLELDKKL